jgi:uncharacterized protein (TIGR02598 family)
MLPPPRPPQRGNAHGFSLIEVAIAVSILAVALVALLGLMPAGLSNFRKAMDTTVTAQIAQRIIQDFEQAEFDEVIDLPNLPRDAKSYCPPNFTFRAPKVNEPRLRYFDDQGNELVPPNNGTALTPTQQTAAVYTVNTRIMPRARLPMTNVLPSDVAQITVQVARNPNNRTLPISRAAPSDPNSPDRNLFQATSGIQVFTYHGLIGKNNGR